MPFLLGLIAIVGTIVYWMYRARNVSDTALELVDAANDVRLAARRFGFRRKANKHPADIIEDPNIAIAAIGDAFIELDGFPTHEDKQALTISVAKTCGVSARDAADLVVLGRWIVGQCNGPLPAIDRLSRNLYRESKTLHFQKVMDVIKSTTSNAGGNLTDQQKAALNDIQRGFKL